jgi:hypothetical protein
MKSRVFVVSAIACLLAPVVVLAGDGAAAVFEKMKTLEGSWRVDTPNGEGTINYRVASAGSIVIEELFPGTDHEMMTVYHMDGERLVATHYCAVGNQPRFELDSTGGSADEFRFAFDGGSNMKPSDGHIHEGSVRIVDQDHVEETWSFFKDGKLDHAMTFKMTRSPAGVDAP